MSLALIFAGILLLVASVRDTQADLLALVKGDLSGPNNFVEWIVALALVGAIGYIPKMRSFSIALLALVLLAIFLKKGQGFFDQLNSTVKNTTVTKG